MSRGCGQQPARLAGNLRAHFHCGRASLAGRFLGQGSRSGLLHLSTFLHYHTLFGLLLLPGFCQHFCVSGVEHWLTNVTCPALLLA